VLVPLGNVGVLAAVKVKFPANAPVVVSDPPVAAVARTEFPGTVVPLNDAVVTPLVPL
jgi:hypothetical protein